MTMNAARFFVLIGLCLPRSTSLGETAPKLNIIFILADDLGRMDTAVFGAKHYETPVIDRLAADGMRFTDFHAKSPNCAPSRALRDAGN